MIRGSVISFLCLCLTAFQSSAGWLAELEQAAVKDTGGAANAATCLRVQHIGSWRFKHRLACSVSFSKDGKRLYSLGHDGRLRSWDPDTGEEKDKPLEVGKFTQWEFGSDRSTLALLNAEGCIVLWDISTGKQRLVIGRKTDPISHFRVSPDGSQVASVESDKSVAIRKATDGKLLHSLEGPIDRLVFAPDGKSLMGAIAGGARMTRVVLWNAESGKVIRRGKVHGGGNAPFDFLPDGKGLLRIQAGGRTGCIWDLEFEEKQFVPLSGTLGHVWTPDGKAVVLRGSRSVAIRDLSLLKVLGTFDAPECKVPDPLALSSDGRRLASIGQNNIVVWKVGADYQIVADEKATACPFYRAAGPNKGGLTLIDENWQVYDGRSPEVGEIEVEKRSKLPIEAASVCTLSGDGGLLATTEHGTEVHIWDTRTGKEVHREKEPCQALKFAPDGKTLAILGGREISFLDVEKKKTLAARIEDYTGPAPGVGPKGQLGGKVAKDCGIISSAWSADSRTLATYGNVPPISTAGMPVVLRLHEAQTQKQRQQLFSYYDSELCWSEHATHLALAGNSLAAGHRKTIWMFELAGGKQKQITRLNPAEKKGVVDASKLVGMTTRGKIRLLAAGKADRDVPTRYWHDDVTTLDADVTTIALSACETRLVSGDKAGFVHVWDTVTGKRVVAAEVHRAAVAAVAFFPDGRILSRGDDGVVAILECGKKAKDNAKPRNAASPKEPTDGQPSRTVLDMTDRTILKEPSYDGMPRYGLLAIGPEGKFRAWMVHDGDTLYVDRNGDGDLTQKTERIVCKESHGRAGKRQFRVPDLVTPDGIRHKELMVSFFELPRQKTKAAMMTIEIAGFGKQYAGLNRSLEFAATPEKAPVIHFNGPLTMALACKSLATDDDNAKIVAHIGTFGPDRGAFAPISIQIPPPQVHPVAEVEFPHRDPDQAPIKVKVILAERC